MRPIHVHIIHVGPVANKGTYALVRSEISEIKKTYENVRVTISTDDVKLLLHLEPTFESFPSLVDIPYVLADIHARQGGYDRASRRYKVDSLARMFVMPLQALLTLLSASLMAVGFSRVYRSETLTQIRDADLIISTADENFKEGNVYLCSSIYWTLSWWTILFSRMIDVIVAKRTFGKRVVVFPNSVGPFRTRLGKLMARTIFNNIDLLMLRENISNTLLKDLGVNTRCIVTSDVALLFPVNESKFPGLLPKGTIGVCPALYAMGFYKRQRDEYVLAHSKLLDYLIGELDYSVVFLPLEISTVKRDDDVELCRAITYNMKHKDQTRVIETSSIDEFRHYLGQLEVLITSRMHPAVLACAYSVPTLMIAYDHKQTGFFDQIALNDYSIEINEVQYERLFRLTNLLLHNKQMIRHDLEFKIPAIQTSLRTSIRRTLLQFVSLQKMQ